MAYRFSQSLIEKFTTEILKTICPTLMHEVISVAKTEFSLNTESKPMKRIFTYKNLKLYFEVVMRNWSFSKL